MAVECGLQLTTNHAMQYIAGMYASIPTLELAEELDMTFCNSVVNGAADSGRVSIVNHLLQGRQHLVRGVDGYRAAQNGDVDMLKSLTQNGCMFTSSTCNTAATSGQLLALQYILSTLDCTCNNASCERYDWLTHSAIQEAALGGNIEMVNWLQQQQHRVEVEMHEHAMLCAASAGHIAMCAYLHLHLQHCPWSTEACKNAARGGHADTLRCLHELGYPWNESTICITAASSGTVAVMEYLLQQGVVLTAAQLTEMLNAAGAHNHMHAAQWLRQQGADWPTVLRFGIYHTWHGKALAWARAEGCKSPATP
jgi:hypothetical protein